MFSKVQSIWRIVKNIWMVQSMSSWLWAKLSGGAVVSGGVGYLSFMEQISPPIIVLLVLLAFALTVWTINGVMWWCERVSAKTSKAETSKLPTQVVIPYLENLVHDQKHNPQNYLYARLSKLFPSSPTEIGIVVEWFNCSVFDIEFDSVTGEVILDRVSLGHQITLRNKQPCSVCHSCTCTFDIAVDKSVLQRIDTCIADVKGLNCELRLTWTVESSQLDKPFPKQGPEGTKLVVPSQN